MLSWRVFVALVLVASVYGGPVAAADELDSGAAGVIETYRRRIPELMAEQGIPGLAVVVVDGDDVLWADAFGSLERDGEVPVTTDTLFSVQSTSKLFTATAVMIAVEDGLIDLDEPITTYLPDFTVNSAFEEHPESRISTRMLLAHTAGFTHEAPIGNNAELDPGTFQEHVASISETWLRFPVGSGYAYSNLGIDLAGAILERVYQLPLPEVMRRTLLDPIGMERSTFDREEIRSATDRAAGHVAPVPEVPVDVPMTAAGGLYSSADDLARFLRFQLNDGTIEGHRVLDPESLTEMRTIPEPNAGDAAGYALGVGRTRWMAGRNADLFSHGGAGFGFLSDLWWLPQLQLGIAILTNSADHDLQGSLALSILSDLVHQPGSEYAERLAALPSRLPPMESDGRFQPPANLRQLIEDAAMPATSDQTDRWAGLAGVYRPITWGVISPMEPTGRFGVEDGAPWFETTETGRAVRHRLVEIEPSLFLSDDGETLDLRGQEPMWANLPLVRSSGGPASWQWIGLAAAVALAVGWLVVAAGWAIRRARMRSRAVSLDGGPERALSRVAWALGVVTALLVLASVALIVVLPGLVDSGFIGWLEMPLPIRLAFHLPVATGILGVCLIGIVIAAWRRSWWSGLPRAAFAGLAGAVGLVAVQLGAWRLIGWGFG